MVHVLIVMLLIVCFVEALEENPAYRFGSTIRRKRFFRRSCHDVRLICPTQEKQFVLRSSWMGRGCELEGPVVDKIIQRCNNSIMEQCKEEWVDHIDKDNNNCGVPIPIAKELDSVFFAACTLHDLCYLSLNTDRYDCDRWFLHNLKQICTISRLPYCKITAHIMYKVVRVFGGQGFKRMHKWAEDHCSSKSTESPIFGSGGSPGSGVQPGSGIVPVIPEISLQYDYYD